MRTAYTHDPTHVHHCDDGHPEHPRRLTTTLRLLEDRQALAPLVEVPAQEAPDEAIARVHNPEYVALLDAICVRGGAMVDVDTYATAQSAAIARRGLGGLLNLVDAVMTGEADNGFALIRPPGHHARPFAAMGFCLFGNAAAAARHAQHVHGAERILIVDFDVHHGNGTQEMFEADPNVLAFSSHQYPFYPGTGAIDEIGVDEGAGATVNVPLPMGVGDAALVELYRQILLPLAQRHRPDLVLVAAGYDGHRLDPLADHALTARGYADLARVVMEVADTHCDGRLVLTLEGGYNPDALAHSILATLAVLQDPTAEVDDPLVPSSPEGPDLKRLTADLQALHKLS